MFEYHPEPWNEWATIGDLEIPQAYHAILSIKMQDLPCLSGKELKYYHQFPFCSPAECPPLPPKSGHLCASPESQDCLYDGRSGGSRESPFVVNCCCGRCEFDMTCAPDSISGFGLWQKMHPMLCPTEGCGSEGKLVLLSACLFSFL